MNLSEIKIGDILYTGQTWLANDRDTARCPTCNHETSTLNGEKKLQAYSEEFQVCGLGDNTFFYKRSIHGDDNSYFTEIYESDFEQQYFATKEEAEAAAIAKFENEVQ